MLYFTHSELAKKSHVSLRTVHNWIDATKSGRLDLDLHTENNKTYVANTARNMEILRELTDSRRKYRNSKAAKTVEPSPEFYELYNDQQIYDIATDLEIHHEIPRQYNYFDGGADHWDKYIERLAFEESRNMTNSTMYLLRVNQGYIDELLSSYKKVNIIDIGVGNAYPTKEFLQHLLDKGILGRYIALDISPSMLKIAERNIKKWFGDKVAYEGYECDINKDRFSHLLINEYTQKNSQDTINIALYFGGTLANMRNQDTSLRVIHDSLGINDLFMYPARLDVETSRYHFDFDLKPGQLQLAPIHRLVADLLNIDQSYYQVEMGYDPVLKQRFERIRLNVSLSLKLKFAKGERHIDFNKGDTILTWRAALPTAVSATEQLDRNDFYMLHSSQTPEQEYMLTISRVKHD